MKRNRRWCALCVATLVWSCSPDDGVEPAEDASIDTARPVLDSGSADGSGDGTSEAVDAGDVQDVADGSGDTIDAGTDGALDAEDTADSAVPLDALPPVDADAEVPGPRITGVLPQLVVDEGLIYVSGERLVVDDDPAETRARVATFFDGVEVIIPMPIADAQAHRLVLIVPSDFSERINAQGLLEVETPDGLARWLPVFGTADTSFSGKTRLDEGLAGNVYRLVDGAPRLPDLDDACNDELVVNVGRTSCPFTTVLVPNLDVPATDWEVGFPGIGAELQEWFAIRFSGYLDVPAEATWRLRVCSDDGSRVWLQRDGAWEVVADNDGQHAMVCSITPELELAEGLVPIRVDYFQGPRTRVGLTLEWQRRPDGLWETVPETAFRLFAPDEP